MQNNKPYKFFIFFCFTLLFFSCAHNSQQKNNETVAVNTDSTEVKSYLDTLVTGKPFPVKGKEVEAGKPIIIKAGAPEITNGFSNTHDVGFLKTIKNVEGKVLPTIVGKTVKASSKNAAYVNAKIVTALEPGMREQNPLGLKFYDIQQGLSSSYIRCMLQDHNGNIWFGTGSGGACKFDGNDFTYFTEKQGIPNNSVVCMIEDHNGNIWFGTDGGGVCKYDGTSFNTFF